MEISHPDSPKYGQHLSFQEAGTMFRNTAAERRTLHFLTKHGVSRREVKMSPHGEFIRVTTTVAKLEKLLGAQFHQYTSIDGKHKVFRALDFVVPTKLRQFVASVGEVNYLPVVPSSVRVSMSRERQSGNVSPSLLNSFYKITSNSVESKSTASVFESLGQSFMPSDVTAFQQLFNLQQTPVANVVGVNSPSSCADDPNNCAEASLDVQWLLAVSQNASLWFWSMPG